VGVVRSLYSWFLKDAAEWETANNMRLILWCTTGTPSSFNAVHVLFGEPRPSATGEYNDWGKEVTMAIRQRDGIPICGGVPFVQKDIAIGTRYYKGERSRIERVCREKHFTLFKDLGVDERQGGRLLMVCRVPLHLASAR
jgi:hypothetical protein